jgi:diguanylate cyclase (GGDEF)-like protein
VTEAAVPARLRIVIADDTEDVRALLRYTLELDGRFEVVGQAADGMAAVDVAAAEQPDAIVLDLAMPVLDGISAIPLLKRAAPLAKIIVLSSFDAEQMADQALAAGAAGYVEKATFQALTDVLVETCRFTAPLPGDTSMLDDDDALTVRPAPRPAEEDDRSVGDIDATMRKARWVGAVFALLQFSLYTPPPGVRVPFPQVPVALGVAAVLVAINLLSLLGSSRRDRFAVRLGYVQLGLDTAVILAIVWLFSFDPTSALWALLIVPVLEGALRLQLRGAMGAWATTSVAYLLRDLWAGHHFAGQKFTMESVTYRAGIVLIVAITTGHLARSFAKKSEQHCRARAESERRAELLGLVATAGRKLAALDVDELLESVVQASVALGFDGVELCQFDATAKTWHATHQRGAAAANPPDGTPLDAGLAANVRARQETLIVDATIPWRQAGYRSVVATPIRAGDEVVAALIVATVSDAPVNPSEVECLELLAAQAGVGVSNVRLLNRIRHQALHDALTGLPNQLLFEDRVKQSLAQAGRINSPAALLFVDLDRFKKVNDTLGHEFGNELLRQVAGRLLGVIRSGDTVARMGGDEFTLLLPRLSQIGDAGVVAGKVVEAFRTPFVVGSHQFFITPSVGIALFPSDGLGYEALLKHADIAMYRAKGRGGNTYEMYFAGRREEVAYPRLALEADLHHALPRKELYVAYQPQIDLTTGRVVAVEALVRWRHSQLGEVAPGEFLPLAEEAGLIGTIDTWVMQSACRQAQSWRQAGLPEVRVAVNVSGRHLMHPRFAETVIQALKRSGLVPTQLELEITEGVAVSEMREAIAALARLRGLGVRIAIDDFGTGYSMLSRLRQLPLDTLKIDRSLVSEIVSADDDAPIISATIAMSASLGLEVVAEGVETQAQLDFLRRHGCQFAQGFLLARPSAPEVVAALLQKPTTLAGVD